jgi:hypothetical protein
MPRSLRILVPLLLGLAAVVLLCSVGLSMPYSRTLRVEADQEQLAALLNQSSYGLQYKPDVARQACHRVLRMREGNHHDAFLMLRDCGDLSSVPHLVRALRWHPALPSGGLVCTTAHGLEALKAITHEDFGLDLNAWERWSEKQLR